MHTISGGQTRNYQFASKTGTNPSYKQCNIDKIIICKMNWTTNYMLKMYGIWIDQNQL